MNVSANYYEVLGVRPTATVTEIRQRYLELLRGLQSQPGGEDEETRTLYTTAYNVLRDSEHRQRYNVEHYPFEGIVNCISTVGLVEVEKPLDYWGFRRFTLHGEQVTDKTTFFAQAALDLPQPEGLIAGGWDALMDNLWSELPDTPVALVWTHVEVMLNGGLSDLLDAADVFRSLARERPSNPFYLFLCGEGPNFEKRGL